MTVNGRVRQFGGGKRDHLTKVITRYSEKFIGAREPQWPAVLPLGQLLGSPLLDARAGEAVRATTP